ncbi:MAG: carboxymuconolactone decarboxylase family protein [Acidimicrobiales bacterium]
MTDDPGTPTDSPGRSSSAGTTRTPPPAASSPEDDWFDKLPQRVGRLPAPLRAELDAGRAALYAAITGGMRASGPFPLVDDEGRLLGPFAAMLANPAVGEALEQLGIAIRTSTRLTPREREIAILEVAHSEHSEYESWAHQRVARSIGMTVDEVLALQRGEEAETLSLREVLVRRVAVSLCAHGGLAETLFQAAAAALGSVVLADLVHLVGYYRLLSLSLAAWQIPAPARELPLAP